MASNEFTRRKTKGGEEWTATARLYRAKLELKLDGRAKEAVSELGGYYWFIEIYGPGSERSAQGFIMDLPGLTPKENRDRAQSAARADVKARLKGAVQ